MPEYVRMTLRTMKIMLLSAGLCLTAGAVGGGFYEASALRHFHVQYGLPMPLQDWMYVGINATIFGAVGFVVGVAVGAAVDWLMRHWKSMRVS
jgi:hypothetical protein